MLCSHCLLVTQVKHCIVFCVSMTKIKATFIEIGVYITFFYSNIFYKTKTVATCSHRLPFILLSCRVLYC